MRLTIVYDNETTREDLKSDWGFAAWIQSKEYNILFDTGAKGGILVENMRTLGFNPAELDAVVVSHDHWDHTGGLSKVLSEASDIDVYVTASFSDETKSEIESKAQLVEVSGPQQIADGVYSTGEIIGDYDGSDIGEQALVVDSGSGLIVVTGCSHAPLEKIIDTAGKIGEVYGVVGGFHGFSKYDALEGIDLIVPTHCTQHKKEINDMFGDRVEYGGVGWSKKFRG